MIKSKRAYRLLLKWDKIMIHTVREQEEVFDKTGKTELYLKLNTISEILEDLRVLRDKNYKRKLIKIIDRSIAKDLKDGKCYYHGRYFCNNKFCIEHERERTK